MVTKRKAGEKEEKKGRVKVGKLKLKKEAVKDLSASQEKQVKGGRLAANIGIAYPTSGGACEPTIICKV